LQVLQEAYPSQGNKVIGRSIFMAKDTTSEKKSEKTEKKKPGKIRKWFKDLKIEFKKVVWPSKKTVADNTSVVVGVIALSAVLVGLLDTGFLELMRLIYR